MSDLIYRQKAIEALKKNRAFYCNNTPESFRYLSYGEKCRVDEIDACIAELVSLQSAEPEIICCQDCEYGEQDYEGEWFCRNYGFHMRPYDGSGFCSEAERRTDGRFNRPSGGD